MPESPSHKWCEFSRDLSKFCGRVSEDESITVEKLGIHYLRGDKAQICQDVGRTRPKRHLGWVKAECSPK